MTSVVAQQKELSEISEKLMCLLDTIHEESIGDVPVGSDSYEEISAVYMTYLEKVSILVSGMILEGGSLEYPMYLYIDRADLDHEKYQVNVQKGMLTITEYKNEDNVVFDDGDAIIGNNIFQLLCSILRLSALLKVLNRNFPDNRTETLEPDVDTYTGFIPHTYMFVYTVEKYEVVNIDDDSSEPIILTHGIYRSPTFEDGIHPERECHLVPQSKYDQYVWSLPESVFPLSEKKEVVDISSFIAKMEQNIIQAREEMANILE